VGEFVAVGEGEPRGTESAVCGSWIGGSSVKKRLSYNVKNLLRNPNRLSESLLLYWKQHAQFQKECQKTGEWWDVSNLVMG